MRTLSLTITVSATLALAACGGEGGPGPTAGSGDGSSSRSTSGSSAGSPSSTGGPANSSTPTPGTADPTTSSSSSRRSTSSSTTSTDTGAPFDAQEFTGKLQDAVDANPTAKIDVSVTLAGQQDAQASGVQDLGDDKLDMQVDLGGQKLGYRLVDGQYYLAQPPKWVAVTEGSTNPLITSTLEQIKLLSMRRQFDAFVAGVETAGDKGTEEVDGVSTTHYTATVDTHKVLAELDIDPAPGAPESVIYDVWLDEDDLIRKMSFTQNGAVATMTASEWGEPVTITKPKASELAKVP